MKVFYESFGQPSSGGVTDLIRLTTGSGSQIALIPLGARLVEAHFPDREGALADLVLGFDSIHDYLELDTYAGSIAGRYANRIAGAAFEIEGETFTLEANEGRNHVHGGFDGLDRQLWSYEVDEAAGAVTFSHVSPAGHGGYPGELAIQVTYRLFEDDRLSIDMTATTSAATVINLVHHSYWNLAGHHSGSVLDQLLMLDAMSYTPVDQELLPTGELATVGGTPVDFRESHPISERIGALPAIGGAGRLEADAPGGYDHNWVLDGTRGDMHLAARMTDPVSGRQMTLTTTEAGVQMYTAGYMKELPGKGGARYDAGAGITLETQTFPCSPNIPAFPSAELRPGSRYEHSMLFEFTTIG